MANRTCLIQDCENPVRARGWCNKHYIRWRTQGDPETVFQNNEGCAVEGCERRHQAKGYCQKHYARWRLHGDPKKGARKPASNAKCAVEDCTNKGNLTRGWCRKHYVRWQAYGDPTAGADYYSTPEESFENRRKKQGDCVVWTGNKNPDGYGRLWVHKSMVLAHRYAWEQENGPVPQGYEINHICWTPSCVKIDHLEIVTRSQNNTYKKGPRSDNAIGFRNVSRHRNKWRVRLRKHGKDYDYGLHPTPEKAAEVAIKARAEVFGKFAGRG